MGCRWPEDKGKRALRRCELQAVGGADFSKNQTPQQCYQNDSAGNVTLGITITRAAAGKADYLWRKGEEKGEEAKEKEKWRMR